MARLGHDVVGLDVDQTRVAGLASGEPPFFEPGLAGLLDEQLATGRLRFTTDPSLITNAQVHFIAVGTPQLAGRNAADLSYVRNAVETVIAHTDTSAGPVVIAGKSTVPVGTAAQVQRAADASGKRFVVVWNPEFLREGHGISDTLAPNRIVYGLPDDPRAAEFGRERLDECYAQILASGVPRLVTNHATAELVKVAANSFLATKISFINAMAELCDATGADVTELAQAIGHDDRIGKKFLSAGVGFGGGCLPKDIRAFMARAGELGVDEALTFLREVDAINLRQRDKAVELASGLLGGRFTGHKVTVLGATFKPDSDDLRDSPALDIAERIWAQGADLVITDPMAGPALRAMRPNLQVVDDTDDALRGADLVLLLTEWRTFAELDPVRTGELVRTRAIIDGRNVLDPHAWIRAGWAYRGMGRHGRPNTTGGW